MGADEGRTDDDAVRALRASLAAQRDRAHERAEALARQFEVIVEATAQTNTDDEHDPEGATIGFERAQVGALRDQALARLAELEAAERRLGTDAYGRCERCGAAIPHERLLARPDTRWCRRCAR
jgi:DnaK suppressor protein